MHNRLRQLFESIVLFRFRSIFSLIYHFFKHNHSIINTPFYESYLLSEIRKCISTQLHLFDGKHKLPGVFGRGLIERCVEIPWVLNHMSKKKALVLDAGSSLNFPEILFSEKLTKKTIIISNLNPERNCYWSSGISYLYHDLRRSFFTDALFDEIVCISVLEHIGLDNSRYIIDKKYIQNRTNDYLGSIEIFRRILKNNGKCLITVPFGKYENLGWMQVFDETMVKNIVRIFKPKKYSIAIYRYHDNAWNISTIAESRASVYQGEHSNGTYFVASKAVACIELQK